MFRRNKLPRGGWHIVSAIGAVYIPDRLRKKVLRISKLMATKAFQRRRMMLTNTYVCCDYFSET